MCRIYAACGVSQTPTSIVYKKGDSEEKSYFFTRNAQGDIVAVYRNSDSKLMGTYDYDLWGKLICITEAEEGIDTDGILTKNPIRYRGYYYDNETGFYNLNARYYDPQIRRFISADSMNLLMVATTSVNCKNLFNYSENNPVTNKDGSGAVVETVFDVVTLAGSIVDVCCNPTDPWAWAGLVGDAVDLIPVVTGVGEGIKGARAVAKAADKVDDVADAAADAARAAGKADNIPGACFVAGTQIKTQTGNKNIEDIQVGDYVYAKDAETGETGYKQVVQLFIKEATELIHLQIGEERIVTTPTHPFWVAGYGFKTAGELTEGEYVENAAGELLQITSVQQELLTEPVTVYNFEVEDWHTYYVSEEEIFVHNMCSMPAGSKAGQDVGKTDFIVTPKGTSMDTSKDYNLVSVTTPTNQGGEFFQIHNTHSHNGNTPHTHRPQTNTNPVTGISSVKRIDNPTTAADIDYANNAWMQGILRERININDVGGY